MTDHGRQDTELRALLEKIAARAGDPPEHGLEDVATMRRRRVRHRRGAVATAVALAVIVAAATSWLPDDDADDVTSVAHAGSTLRPGELPATVELRCTPHGIVVPVASIRPQRDGLHVTIDNQLPEATVVWVTSEDGGWDSGPVAVEPGRDELRQPAPPGMLTLGCRIDGQDEQRQVDLIDVDGIYEPPELDCPEDERQELSEPLPVDPPTWSRVGAASQALADAGYVQDGDQIQAPGGYPDEALTDPTVDPVVRVVREGRTVAFAHLVASGAADEPAGSSGQVASADDEPWSQIASVEACTSFLTPGGADDSEDPTSARRPPPS